MKRLLLLAAAAAGCASGAQQTPGSPASTTPSKEGTGNDAKWVFKVKNTAAKTLKIAALEFAHGGGEFKAVGGMAEIAHACRQGTTTIAAGDAIEILTTASGGAVRMRLTYVIDGADKRWVDVVVGPQ